MATWNTAYPGFTYSNGNLTATSTQLGHAVTIGVAVDLTHSKVWFYNPATKLWNNAAIGSQNPATNTGGSTISGIGTPLFPAWSGFFSSGIAADIVIANFGATAFFNTMPSGFSTWNTLAGVTTWNPADKSASIALSNGNLTATQGTSGSSWQSVRANTSLTSGLAYYELNAFQVDTADGWIAGVANGSASLATFIGASATGGGIQTQGSSYNLANGNGTFNQLWASTLATVSHNSGLLYFEVKVNTVDANSGFTFGLANATFNTIAFFVGQDNNGIGNQPVTNAILRNGSTIGTNSSAAGVTVGIATDFTNQKVWFWSPTTSQWNNAAIGSQNPATNTGGLAITALGGAGTQLFPVFGARFIDAAILNSGTSSFANTVPSGFSSWDAPVNVNVNLIGVAGSGSPGTVKVEIDKSLTGVAGSGAAGIIAVLTNNNILGVAGTGHAGTLAANPEAVMIGAAGIGQAGTMTASITIQMAGVAGIGQAGLVAGSVGGISILGVGGTGHPGTIMVELTPTHSLTGVFGVGSAGAMGVAIDVIRVNVPLIGVAATGAAGTLAPSLTFRLLGVAGAGHAGVMAALATMPGLTFAGLSGTELPTHTDDIYFSVRWSDDGGQTWGNPLVQSLGSTGEFLLFPTIKNLGQGRDRIFEISLSSPKATALSGIFIETEIASS